MTGSTSSECAKRCFQPGHAPCSPGVLCGSDTRMADRQTRPPPPLPRFPYASAHSLAHFPMDAAAAPGIRPHVGVDGAPPLPPHMPLPLSPPRCELCTPTLLLDVLICLPLDANTCASTACGVAPRTARRSHRALRQVWLQMGGRVCRTSLAVAQGVEPSVAADWEGDGGKELTHLPRLDYYACVYMWSQRERPLPPDTC